MSTGLDPVFDPTVEKLIDVVGVSHWNLIPYCYQCTGFECNISIIPTRIRDNSCRESVEITDCSRVWSLDLVISKFDSLCMPRAVQTLAS